MSIEERSHYLDLALSFHATNPQPDDTAANVVATAKAFGEYLNGPQMASCPACGVVLQIP